MVKLKLMYLLITYTICKLQCLTVKIASKMGYIAQNIITKAVYYSKGADKIANLVGIHPSTITRNIKIGVFDKEYNGFLILKCTELIGKPRGKSF